MTSSGTDDTHSIMSHNKYAITQLAETLKSIILIIALVIFIFSVTYYCVIRNWLLKSCLDRRLEVPMKMRRRSLMVANSHF